MDCMRLQGEAVLGVLSRHSWWVSRAAASLLPPRAGEDTRSLLAMEAEQTIVERKVYCSSIAGLSDIDPKYP